MSKFIIPLDQLPPPMADGTQKFRFRIISEDRNVVSYWSPVLKIINNVQISDKKPYFSASAIYDNRDNAVSLTLGADSNLEDYTEFLDNYDIFVKWDTNAYEFYNRMSPNGISIPVSGSATVQIKGQYPSQYVLNDDGTSTPTETSSLKVFETGSLNLVDLRDLTLISASISTVSASVVQVQQDVQNVEGLVYALS